MGVVIDEESQEGLAPRLQVDPSNQPTEGRETC